MSKNEDISSTNGLIVQFGPDAFNIGLDNLSVTVADNPSVPEPGLRFLMGAGFVAIQSCRRVLSGSSRDARREGK